MAALSRPSFVLASSPTGLSAMDCRPAWIIHEQQGRVAVWWRGSSVGGGGDVWLPVQPHAWGRAILSLECVKHRGDTARSPQGAGWDLRWGHHSLCQASIHKHCNASASIMGETLHWEKQCQVFSSDSTGAICQKGAGSVQVSVERKALFQWHIHTDEDGYTCGWYLGENCGHICSGGSQSSGFTIWSLTLRVSHILWRQWMRSPPFSFKSFSQWDGVFVPGLEISQLRGLVESEHPGKRVGEGVREGKGDGDGQLSCLQHPPRYRLWCLLYQAGANLSTSTNTLHHLPPPTSPWSLPVWYHIGVCRIQLVVIIDRHDSLTTTQWIKKNIKNAINKNKTRVLYYMAGLLDVETIMIACIEGTKNVSL